MSRFVSAGTDEAPPTERDEAWRKAQQELEAKQMQKAEAGKQEGGKSLYETLQSNKAAKQEAFEEANRLRNQFRSLDEDEIEFLDSVMESTRAKEAEVKKETLTQLEVFRRQQEEAEKAAQQAGDAGPPAEAGESWAASGPRKRKKGREGPIAGVKLRRTSTNEKQSVASPAGDEAGQPPPKAVTKDAAAAADEKRPADTPSGGSKAGEVVDDDGSKISAAPVKSVSSAADKPASPPPSGLGLAAYSSDEDE
ncbi:uncharacterized protein LTR77_009637 [Saxophila tyrrhenica]|uniref:FAM192A/Fyv6 N-terminal domain-containing protein n=1 Tax=Saxophila tyrrhenica TaxID=1690608 RepID=A0AAV9NYS3_9PEZI|nr:hypothetical protein LTR77_009637 [Saxophila tyrrhenica]